MMMIDRRLVVLFAFVILLVDADPDCLSGHRACADGSGCYPESGRCDLFEDCDDASDELNCDDRSCSGTDFQCVDDRRTCIAQNLKCDGSNDCFDGSDEQNCGSFRCDFDGDFKCETGHQCINPLLRCDHVTQCTDGSDEKGCNHTVTTKLPQKPDQTARSTEMPLAEMPVCNTDTDVDCYGNGSLCLSQDVVCDGRNDCPNGFDELDCNTDEDVPADGDYPSGVHAHLLVANGNTIKQFNVINGESKDISVGTGHVYRIDYSHAHDKIFWIDSHSHVINRMHKDGTEREPLVNTFIDTPVALAYDWVHNAIYWADSGLRHGQPKIEVVSLNSRQRLALFTAPDVDSPRVLIVDPRPNQGFMYWGQAGDSNAGIYRAGLDGSNRTCIACTQTQASSFIKHPTGLTFDYIGNRLLWLDSQLFAVISLDLTTGQQRIFAEFTEADKGLNGLAIFGDWIYWAEGHDMTVYKMRKTAHSNQDSREEAMIQQLPSPNDVVIYHNLRQPQSESYCGAQNGGCSHFCLPSPVSVGRRACACPNVAELNKYQLSSDRKTCVRSTGTSSTTGGAGGTSKSGSDGSSSTGTRSSAASLSTLGGFLLTIPGTPATTTIVAAAGQHNIMVGVIVGICAVIMSAIIGSVAN